MDIKLLIWAPHKIICGVANQPRPGWIAGPWLQVSGVFVGGQSSVKGASHHDCGSEGGQGASAPAAVDTAGCQLLFGRQTGVERSLS